MYRGSPYILMYCSSPYDEQNSMNETINARLRAQIERHEAVVQQNELDLARYEHQKCTKHKALQDQHCLLTTTVDDLNG